AQAVFHGPLPRSALSAHHQLAAVPVWVATVDATVLSRAAAHLHAVALLIGLERFVGAGGHAQGQVVEIVTRCQGGVSLLFEEGHPLRAGVQKGLAVALSVDRHAQDLGVELLRPRHISDMQHDMVDPVGPDHLQPSSLFSSPSSPGLNASPRAQSTANMWRLTLVAAGAMSARAEAGDRVLHGYLTGERGGHREAGHVSDRWEARAPARAVPRPRRGEQR